MKPLILTCFPIDWFEEQNLGDLQAVFFFHFTWGKLPPPDELTAHLGPRTSSRSPRQGGHWSDFAMRWNLSEARPLRDLSLAEFCQQYETVELWFDTRPDAQLQLIWLLDYFRAYPEALARLKLRLLDQDIVGLPPGGIKRWRPPLVNVTERELAPASAAWNAYRSSTPEACFNLLSQDLSALQLLRPVLLDLLAELPSASSGLGATETRMLELIAQDFYTTNALFYLQSLRQTRVYRWLEMGHLLDAMAFGPMPAISGLDDELRTIDKENQRDRHDAYLRSAPRLTEFGKAVLAHEEDFSRHNPIDRWWGGTHLTNDNLWRYDPALTAPSQRR
jgi:hypothetical protein